VAATVVGVLGLLPAIPVAGLAPPAVAADVPVGGRYVEEVFPDVDVTTDVAYRETVSATGDPVTLTLDIYEPAGDTVERRPVVLVAHGGFFALGDKTDSWGGGLQVAEPFVRRGYVVVSIQYRTRSPACLPAPGGELLDAADCRAAALDAYDDAFASLAWLRDNATDLRIDPDAIVPLGWSAGGSLAWALAWFQGSAERPEPSGIAAAVSNAGIPFQDLDTNELPRPVRPDDPPVIAFHGTADSVLPFEQAERPCTEAADAGARCELVVFPGAGHPLVDPEGLNLHAAEIYERTFEFLAEEVLAPQGFFDEDDAPSPTTTTPGDVVSPGRPDTPPPAAPTADPVVAEPRYTG
jgi:acetyl esterase/lipase